MVALTVDVEEKPFGRFAVVMKAKSKVRRTARLAPVMASLAALAMVAACARTNNSKTQISPQTADQIAEKIAASGFAAYNQAAPENMEFAKSFQGASIVIEDRTDDQVKAKIRILIANKKPITVEGVLAITGDSAKATTVDFAQVDGTDDQTISVKAKCLGSDCKGVGAEVFLMQEDTATTPAADTAKADASKADPTANLKISAKVSKAATPAKATAATPAPAPDATGTAAVVPPASSEAPADDKGAPTPSDLPEIAPTLTPTQAPVKKMKPVAENLLIFQITQLVASPGETAEAKVKRYSTMGLLKSGEISADQAGSKDSFEVAFKKAYPDSQVPGQDQAAAATPTPSPTASPTPAPTATPDPTASPAPTAAPTASPSPAPAASSANTKATK